MFTIDQIKEAHAKVKSGADFPAYVKEIIALGVKKYDAFVSDGHCLYYGDNGFQVASNPKYSYIEVASESDADTFRHNLKIHQQGQTDYPTFCRHSAESGVEKWTVDTVALTCTYYDKAGNNMLTEIIPS